MIATVNTRGLCITVFGARAEAALASITPDEQPVRLGLMIVAEDTPEAWQRCHDYSDYNALLDMARTEWAANLAKSWGWHTCLTRWGPLYESCHHIRDRIPARDWLDALPDIIEVALQQ